MRKLKMVQPLWNQTWTISDSSDRQCKAVHKSTIKKVEVVKIKEEKNREQKSKQVVQMTLVFDINNPLFRTLQKLPTPNLILPLS